MTVSERATFRLERLEWSRPDRVELAGRWHGVSEDELLWPALVVRGTDETVRVPALWRATEGRPSHGLWEATFAWRYEPGRVDSATLELGSGLAVELPSVGRGRRRFGRVVLDVRSVRQQEDAGAFQRLRAHTQAVVAREDVAAAQEEARRAREKAERARKDLISERDRAKAESNRMRDALMTAEKLAERAVGEKEAINKLLKVELADAYAAVGQERKRADEADRRRQERDTQLERDAAAMREEFERLHRSVEVAVAERDAAVVELQHLRTRLEDEHQREVAALRERLAAAEHSAAEGAHARADLERALEQARERSGVLASRLAAVRQAVEVDLAVPADADRTEVGDEGAATSRRS